MRGVVLFALIGGFLSMAAGVVAQSEPARLRRPGLAGRWKVILERGGQDRDYYFHLVEEGGKTTGVFISPRSGEYPVKSASVDGDRVKIAFERTIRGVPVVLDLAGRFHGRRTVHGVVTVEGAEYAGITMKRLPDPVGVWTATSHAPDGGRTFESVLEISRAEAGYEGTFTQGRASTRAKSIAWQADSLVIELGLPVRDQEVKFSIEAAFASRNRLEGRWTTGAADNSGDWQAVRKTATPSFELVGRWNAVLSAREKTRESLLEVSSSPVTGLQARYEGSRGELAYKHVAVDGDEVYLELEVEIQGTPVTYVVDAVFRDRDTLEGYWQVRDYAEYSGAWRASRQVEAAEPQAAER